MHYSAKRGSAIACRLSVTLVDCDYIGLKSWKLIVRTISPTPSLFVAQRPSTYSHGRQFILKIIRHIPSLQDLLVLHICVGCWAVLFLTPAISIVAINFELDQARSREPKERGKRHTHNVTSAVKRRLSSLPESNTAQWAESLDDCSPINVLHIDVEHINVKHMSMTLTPSLWVRGREERRLFTAEVFHI